MGIGVSSQLRREWAIRAVLPALRVQALLAAVLLQRLRRGLALEQLSPRVGPTLSRLPVPDASLHRRRGPYQFPLVGASWPRRGKPHYGPPRAARWLLALAEVKSAMLSISMEATSLDAATRSRTSRQACIGVSSQLHGEWTKRA